jgi:radical SAM superfamily enzyme YgiQ (UPF0313 family)
MLMSLEPSRESVGVDRGFQWGYPVNSVATHSRTIGAVWYVALPLTSAHRGGHSGGGADIDGVAGQERYSNEGTVYPHAALVEMITYQQECFPDIGWKYLDMSHVTWREVQQTLSAAPPDVLALSVYTATALWAYIVAAEARRVNPNVIIIFGNDHAGILHREILQGRYGSRLVDFVCTGNNGPFTMMGLLHVFRGQLPLERVPSVAFRRGADVINQAAPTFPLNRRKLPDYRLIESDLEQYYDKAFAVWYSKHYTLKRMVTLPLDAGCTWGNHPKRRCKHCSIQGLTPKTTDVATAIPVLESVVGELGANVYAAGDSTFGFSASQWDGSITYLDELAEACATSPILRSHRFMLCYGLIHEFLQSADLCKGFARTWNVGIESFSPTLLKEDSKGVNKGLPTTYEAFELAERLDYKLYVSGIFGLPGTTMKLLRSEVDNWLAIADRFDGSITTVSVAAPGIIPGSRMYHESYTRNGTVRALHGELIACRQLTKMYIEANTEVTLDDVEAAIADVGRGVIGIGARGSGMKFGGYMLGGKDTDESAERSLLDDLCTQL